MSAETPAETSAERRPENYVWPLTALVLVIAPQVLVPARHRLGPPLLVPSIEAVTVLILLAIAAKPGPVPRAARPLVLSLFGVLGVANTLAAARLGIVTLTGAHVNGALPTAGRLLVAAAIVLATNIVTFALLYWQIDRGGPDARPDVVQPYPEFLFPQMTDPSLAPADWRPRFPDYLYVSFTNLVAFSPTDTLPLTHRIKALMALQSVISLAVLVIVLARVINTLPS